MKITWTGRQVELSPAQTEKLTAQFDTVGKLLDNGGGPADAHVVLSIERHIHSAEITVPYLHHELVGQASDADLFVAIHAAVEKLEKQALRVKAKWRDGKRVPRKETAGDGLIEETEATEGSESGKAV